MKDDGVVMLSFVVMREKRDIQKFERVKSEYVEDSVQKSSE